MAAFIFSKGKQSRMTHLNEKDLTVINKALKFFAQPYIDDEKEIDKHALSPKERLLLQQIRTTKKKLAILRKTKT